MDKNTMEVNVNRNCLVTNILQKYLLIFQEKNFIQVWNDMRVSKLHHFHFWLNYPFKLKTLSIPEYVFLNSSII